jgi:putative ABC transport system substrate-binding protein
VAREQIVRGLSELGRTEGEDFSIEARGAAGSNDRLPALAAELVQLEVDVIVTPTQTGALAAKRATSAIPIVFAGIGDPVGGGVVESLARPGGNATGTSNYYEELTPKQLELLSASVASLSRVAVLWHADVAGTHWRTIQAAAPLLGLTLQSIEVRDGDELASRSSVLLGSPAQGLIVLPAAALSRQRSQILGLAMQYRLPAMYPFTEFAHAGGLFAYGPDLADLYRRAATYVDKILRGTRPAELPVEQPTRFDFVINVGTARAIGLTIPSTVLQQATEIIQ